MEPLNGNPIRPLDDVVREHVEAVLAAHFPAVPQWRIAAELGISPTTLIRMKKRWASEEDIVRDRR